MEIEFIGTGTSTGVPQIGCECATCRSIDKKDKRFRTSAIVRSAETNILIDCGPDFRMQMLNVSDKKLDALLVTHSHYDHVGGLDDLRPYCFDGPFHVYAQKNVIEDIKNRLPYCFKEKLYPGVPTFKMFETSFSESFYVGDILVQPLPIWHYKLLINGYKIGDLAYITDAKTIDDKVIDQLRGTKLLVINALRTKPHLSHLSLSECLTIVQKIKPKKTYLIHISHDMGLHSDIAKILPDNVYLAYDGLKMSF